MKKKIINMLICALVIISVSGCKKDTEKINIELEEQSFSYSHFIDDDRVVFMTFNPVYNNTSLYEELEKDNITYKSFIKDLKQEYVIKDGGSSLYYYDKKTKTYGDKSFYLMACNAINGSKNLYLGEKKETVQNMCHDEMNDIKEVSIKIIKASKNGMTLKVTNDTDLEYIFGNDFYLQAYKDSFWVNIKPKNELVFTSIGYTITKDSPKEFKIDWTTAYGSLPKGKYRIVKSFGKAGEIRHYVSQEFEIK